MRRTGALLAAIAVLAGATLTLSACYRDVAYQHPVAQQNEKACGTEDCHATEVAAQSASMHGQRECGRCHENAEAHAKDPKVVQASTDWTIDACSDCHTNEAQTYLYDDNAQVGPFGGSQRVPAQPKVAQFPEYKTIVAGHAFAKDYNEEGAHKYMLEDHMETTRGKFETCIQCKSTKVAYAWKEGRSLTVESETKVTLTHTATEGVPAKIVTVPKGTELTYKTDPVTRLVDASAKLPDGTTYTSTPKPSEDATLANNMLWASTVAAIKETMPYGAGCNHCHDPHSGAERVVRDAMIESIEGTGGVKGTGGVNPYEENSPKSFEKASAKDKRVLVCAQCHVEYVCGKSGIDKKDRDAFGWAKASDLHSLYTGQFGYTQDFKNALMGEALIKSQHPETELYWNSGHYAAGAACSDCHMPEVKRNGVTFRSHWMTSPYKYSDSTTMAKFSEAMGLDTSTKANPCTRCHSDLTQKAIEQQKAFYAQQAEVEKLLSQSVKNIASIKAAGGAESSDYGTALEFHRKAHAVWENLAVSENSMGFHNFEEATSSMAQAKKDVGEALAMEKKLLKK